MFICLFLNLSVIQILLFGSCLYTHYGPSFFSICLTPGARLPVIHFLLYGYNFLSTHSLTLIKLNSWSKYRTSPIFRSRACVWYSNGPIFRSWTGKCYLSTIIFGTFGRSKGHLKTEPPKIVGIQVSGIRIPNVVIN